MSEWDNQFEPTLEHLWKVQCARCWEWVLKETRRTKNPYIEDYLRDICLSSHHTMTVENSERMIEAKKSFEAAGGKYPNYSDEGSAYMAK